ncbi:glucose-6-phosphate isomerase [Desulfopila sp. IMCC35006]|uniref:glucose-6-phosphate isomerase n=1 Tax=Desulfopila sp. IMCC35006 TaxID=2569542 RepID=UPI0010AD2562|nr:glucose-6-phosphate isomerase [Desulfopila sp. IMCC35006]
MPYEGIVSHPAFATLRKLAESPFPLSRPGALTRDRLLALTCRTGEFKLLYGTQRLDTAVLDALQELADESQVIQQFQEMKRGKVINRIDGYESEERMVLHTAARDIFTTPAHPEATGQAIAELDKLRSFLDELASGRIVNAAGQKFTTMVMIGIGGSDLGPRALYLALAAYATLERSVRFISNVDPDDAAAVLRNLDLSRTLVNVVSKSGTTLETLTNEQLVRAAFQAAGLDPGKHFIAVTGKGSPMDNPSSYLRSFYMFDYIGGRYSATSMVGAVMLGFALGYDALVEILRGANDIDRAAEETDIRRNIPLLMAMIGIWNHTFLGHETIAVLPYSQALIRFAAHLQQCDMESNGKSIDRQGNALTVQSGPIVWGEPGTNGQHAFYQLLHQGTTIVPVEFIGFRSSQYAQDIVIKETTSQDKLLANLLAQSLAMATGRDNANPNKRFAGNRPNSILLADRLTPYTMGALLAIYETKIAMQGFVWNINSFDQEGVQLGKVLAGEILEHIGRYRKDDTYRGAGDDVSWLMVEAAELLGS